ncbi:MAG TPA: sigma-54 dependent transcriptional regulator, partial [Vicinamibacteria bacterium]|nr:sigma-54 dependent transcriptional regulator [Vicinamibacteria bacterium]
MARVLVVDDEQSVCTACSRVLEAEGYRVDHALSGRQGVEKVAAGDYDLVLLDLKIPDLPGMDALAEIRSLHPEVTVVIITGYATIQTSIEAIKKGAFDYLPKPFTPEELSLVVSRGVEDRRLRRENASMKRELVHLAVRQTLVGRSRAMEELLAQLRRVAPTDFTVAIYGESGTGKELAARSVHDLSRRREMPFVAVDLSALSPGLVESELFGHVKGAFTGATQGRPGYFVNARGGTLFLDEVSNVSLELQGKLLRALESRRIHAVGSERDVDIDVRLVVATNQDLEELVRAGRFRQDLFYRLNVIPLRLPALRERPEDVPPLAMYFLEEARRSAPVGPRGFSAEAMARLLAHRWPGNVRELRNLVERLVATVDVELVRLEHLPPEMRTTATAAARAEAVPGTAEELKQAK